MFFSQCLLNIYCYLIGTLIKVVCKSDLLSVEVQYKQAHMKLEFQADLYTGFPVHAGYLKHPGCS